MRRPSDPLDMMRIHIPCRFLFSLVHLVGLAASAILLTLLVGASPVLAGERQSALPAVYMTGVNALTSDAVVASGGRLPVEVELYVTKPWNDRGRKELAISWYAFASASGESITRDQLREKGTYLGRTSIRSPRVGTASYPMRVPVVGAVEQLQGEFALVAVVDESESLLAKGVDRIFVAPFPIKVDPTAVGTSTAAIAAFEPDALSLVSVGDEPQLIEGMVRLEALHGDMLGASVSFCVSTEGGGCEPLEVYEPRSQQYGLGYIVNDLPKDEEVTTMFRVKEPRTHGSGDITINAQVWSGVPYVGAPLDTVSRSISIESAPYAVTRGTTDFERDVTISLSQARRALKNKRLAGLTVNPAKLLRGKRGRNRSVDLDGVLATIVSQAPKLAALTKVKQEDSYSLPTGLSSNIKGSRFNMPDGDFPWLNNIGVTAPPPPEQFKGTPFATLNDFNRCIPFFCGPNSQAEAGKEPSQSCIRQYCGTTKEDVNFGGRNPNLIDEQIGFDKNFGSNNFGARVGVVAQAKVFHDKAISDYVGASYEVGAFFGVKLFGYSVPIFEAGSQSVYSPTEIGNSGTRRELKILGLLIEREDAPSQGLSVSISKTYGVKKNADVGLGPISVDIEVEAGGTGGITLAVSQIDLLRGIVGSLTPRAGCGAKAKALTDVGIGRFGIEGELNLFEDRLPATATFNAGLDISKKKVTPQLDFDVHNELDGPNGRIKLLLEIGISPLTQSFSTTIASFSTGTFITPIYDQTKTFGSVSY